MTLTCAAQPSHNPFELTPRLRPTTDSATTSAAASEHPFDLVAPSAAARPAAAAKSKPVPPRPTLSDADAWQRFRFLSIVGICLLLTLLMTVLRGFFQRSYQAFINDTLMNQVYRDREAVGPLPFLLLYSLFFLNGGLFTFFLLRFYDLSLPGGLFLQWGYCIGALAVLMAVKHLMLTFLGALFPLEKEMRLYNFLIMTFGIIIGIMLTPVNILLAYGPESIAPQIVYLALGATVLVYLFRYFRSIFIANRLTTFHLFHFLLYICSVEIAPVMVLVKFVLNQI